MAQIIDLNSDEPKNNERYFVDTNVWFWLTYASSQIFKMNNTPQDYQMKDYPAYIEKALSNGSVLCHCPLTFTEISNVIEDAEHKKYIADSGKPCTKKEFRSLQEERIKVLNEIKIAWDTIESMSACLSMHLDSEFTSKAKCIMDKSNLDPFDAFFSQIMVDEAIDYIVTDDYDFCTSQEHIVVTANKKSVKFS
ncbi:MAG: hypothetical protein COB22_03230 [Cycloclasticus sp.]|nr:MAG: hypothetical protein COB22_03230 [Cycloclasticus sp.]